MSLVRKAALAQFLQRNSLVCIRQQKHDRRSVQMLAYEFEEATIFVVRVAGAERYDCTHVLCEHSIDSMNASWLPPSVCLNKASTGGLGDEGTERLTDFRVEGVSNFVKINEGTLDSGGEQLPDCRLPSARGTDEDQRLGR